MEQMTTTLPLVALRGLTVVPSMIIHFDLNRDMSKKAIEQALNETQQVLLVPQIDPDDGDDARLKRLTLTAKGEEQCQVLQSTIEWLNYRQMDGISAQEQERFFATLEKIEGNAGRLAACILGEDDSWIGEIRQRQSNYGTMN